MSKKRKKSFRPRLRGQKKQNHEYWNQNQNRVLVIGDLHCPFDLDAYFDHCVKAYNDFNCNKVVFIGEPQRSLVGWHLRKSDGPQPADRKICARC